MKIGSIVQAENEMRSGGTVYIQKGKCYVVNSVTDHRDGARYIRVLGDDNQGHDLLAALFTIVG